MYVHRYLSVFFLLFSMFFGSQVLADAIFEQPPDPNIHAGTASTLGFYGKHPGRRSADDFTLKISALVNEIVWWGQHAPLSSGADDFVITFYEDIGGSPRKVLLETRGKVTSAPHATIPNLVEYRALLSSALSAQAGVRYWLSIFNASPEAAWRWNNSVVGNNIRWYSVEPFNNGWKTSDGQYVDASFRLTSVPLPNLTTVSRPNVAIKIILGILILAALWLLITRFRTK